MFYRIFLLQVFVLLPSIFLLQKIKASHSFETRINEDLTLIHSYPQQISSQTKINVNELLNILLPHKNARPKITDQIKIHQNNTFTLKNVSFFPEQNMVAIYNEEFKKIDIFSTKDKGLAQISKDVILGKYEKKKIKNIQKETN